MVRRKNPKAIARRKDPVEKFLAYIADRLRADEPIQLPYGPNGLDHFARNEGAFLLRHRAKAVEMLGASAQEQALSRGKGKALNALADFLDAFNVRIESDEEIHGKYVDDGTKTSDKSVTGGRGPDFDDGGFIDV